MDVKMLRLMTRRKPTNCSLVWLAAVLQRYLVKSIRFCAAIAKYPG